MITTQVKSPTRVELFAGEEDTVTEVARGLRLMDTNLPGKVPSSCSFRTEDDGSFSFVQNYFGKYTRRGWALIGNQLGLNGLSIVRSAFRHLMDGSGQGDHLDSKSSGV